MSTLAESFLCDLQDLEGDSDGEGNEDEGGPHDTKRTIQRTLGDEEDLDSPIIDAIEEYIKRSKSDHQECIVSDLLQQPRVISLLERAKELTPQEAAGGEELELIEQCNQMVIDIDTDILNIHKFVKDIYCLKFPELESIVQAPLEYLAVVLRIQNQTDLTQIDLTDLLPSPTIMALTVAASLSVAATSANNTATDGRRLPAEEFERAVAAAREGLALAEKRKEVLKYLESRMMFLAPNVSAILGPALAARLLTKVGSLAQLAKMPAQNIMLVGSEKRSSLSLSSKGGASSAFSSLLCCAELVVLTPPSYRTRALRILSGKVALAARVDLFREASDGSIGKDLRENVVTALMKAQEPPPAPQKKALAVPDERPRPKRGGRKYRRMRERYEQTEVQKQLNRMQFGEQEDTIGLKAKGLGMLGRNVASGKLRIQAKQTKKAAAHKRRPLAVASATGTSGFSSSLAFTPIQGIELCNPLAAGASTESATAPGRQHRPNYFAAKGKFTKVEEDRAAANKTS